MKRLLLLTCVALINTISFAQIIPSSCTAHDSIMTKYKEDAKRLALLQILNDSLPAMDSVAIPNDLYIHYHRALIAIYNATPIPERDTVLDLYPVRTAYNPEMNEMSILTDTGLFWMNNMGSGMTLSGHPTVDSLISLYSLQIKHYDPNWINGKPMVKFKTDSFYNMKALCKVFESINGVVKGYYPSSTGFHTGIMTQVHHDHTEIIYSYGWGDCFSGCMYWRNWKFKAYNNCSVEFIVSWGDPLTTGLLDAEGKKDLHVYPNPFSYFIEIQGLQQDISYTLYSLSGQLLQSGTTQEGRIFGLEVLAPGAYLLLIGNSEQVHSQLIIKK